MVNKTTLKNKQRVPEGHFLINVIHKLAQKWRGRENTMTFRLFTKEDKPVTGKVTDH